MTRKHEIKCLENVVQSMLGKTSVIIASSNCDTYQFGIFLMSATPNPDSNDFPDFIFDGGGLEHFQITSSKESSKGSLFKIDEKQNISANEERYKRITNDYLSSEYQPGNFVVETNKDIYDMFSYKDFLVSLERNIKKHVKSLRKMHYEEKTVIFLIEQQTPRLFVKQSNGQNEFYKISKDVKALSLFRESCKDVNYIIYFATDSIEVLDLSKISELIANSIEYKNVEGGRLINIEIDMFGDK